MNTFTEELLFGLLFFSFITVIVLTIARYVYLIKKSMVEYGIETTGGWKREHLIYVAGSLLGLGVGLMISAIFSSMSLDEDTADLLIWGTIIISTGLGLLVSYRITANIAK